MHEDEPLEIVGGVPPPEAVPTVEQLEEYAARLFVLTGEKVLEARRRVAKLKADLAYEKDRHNQLMTRCLALAAMLPKERHDALIVSLEKKCGGIDHGQTEGAGG